MLTSKLYYQQYIKLQDCKCMF